MRNFIRFSVLMTIVVLFGCKDITTNPGTAGSMAGRVYGYDTTSTVGYIDSLPNLGIRVSIDGTHYSATSDKDGNWKIDNVPPGTYNISFSKEGYATEKKIAYGFSGNGTAYLGQMKIYQIAKWNASFVLRGFSDYYRITYRDTTIVDSLGNHTESRADTTIYPNEEAFFTCRIFGTDPAASLLGPVLLLFGKTEQLSPVDFNSYTYYVDNLYGNDSYYSPEASGYGFDIRRTALLNAGFHSGDKIYCEAFVSNITEQTIYQESYHGYKWVIAPSYMDIKSGKQVYTGFGDNHSEVKSFILP